MAACPCRFRGAAPHVPIGGRGVKCTVGGASAVPATAAEAHRGRLVQLIAGILLLSICVAIATAAGLGACACLRALRRWHERRMWEDLVARHWELDRELDKIWPL